MPLQERDLRDIQEETLARLVHEARLLHSQLQSVSRMQNDFCQRRSMSGSILSQESLDYVYAEGRDSRIVCVVALTHSLASLDEAAEGMEEETEVE